jgi:inner membrane protein
MDTLTQMLFGATVAQAGFRRRLGRRAIASGAIVALVPDLDIAAGWIGGPFGNFVHHRGLTHSVLFGPVAGILAGWLLWRWHRWQLGHDDPHVSGDALRAWIWLSVLALMTHPIIDVFTSYGTQLLYPISNTRFAINAMPIIDPIYSLALALAVLVGIFARRATLAQDAAAAALIFISIYTVGAWAINERVEAIARAEVDGPAEVTAYPTLFQPLLRRIVVEVPDAVLVGFHSVLDPRPIEWARFDRKHSPAIDAVAATPEARIFRWFSMDNLYWQTRPLENGETLVQALDYRYGMPGGSALGFWGIQAIVGANGEFRREIETFRPPRDASSSAWRDLWIRILGTGPRA